MRECLHHLLHHRQLAVVRFVGEVDVVRHPSHGEWVGGHGCRALGRRVSVPGRRETIDRAFDRTHRLAPRFDARARRDRPTHRFRRDARTDMLGTWGTEATTFTERGGFWSNSSLVREHLASSTRRRRPLSNVVVQTTTRGRHGGSTRRCCRRSTWSMRSLRCRRRGWSGRRRGCCNPSWVSLSLRSPTCLISAWVLVAGPGAPRRCRSSPQRFSPTRCRRPLTEFAELFALGALLDHRREASPVWPTSANDVSRRPGRPSRTSWRRCPGKRGRPWLSEPDCTTVETHAVADPRRRARPGRRRRSAPSDPPSIAMHRPPDTRVPIWSTSAVWFVPVPARR